MQVIWLDYEKKRPKLSVLSMPEKLVAKERTTRFLNNVCRKLNRELVS